MHLPKGFPSPFGFKKLDTEGCEHRVLQGATQTIAEHHPTILLEFNETNLAQCHVEPFQFKELIETLGDEYEFVNAENLLCSPL